MSTGAKTKEPIGRDSGGAGSQRSHAGPGSWGQVIPPFRPEVPVYAAVPGTTRQLVN